MSASGEQTEGGAGVVVEKRGDELCSSVASAAARCCSFEAETVAEKGGGEVTGSTGGY